MMLRAVNQFPKEPGEWNPIRVGDEVQITGVMLACPRCGSRLHLGPAPHPSGHVIEWEEHFTKFSIKTPITCGITKNGKLCQNRFIILHGVSNDAIPE